MTRGVWGAGAHGGRGVTRRAAWQAMRDFLGLSSPSVCLGPREEADQRGQ